ncbi:hypothetical protein [Rhodanobacter sp. DHB23]|uniref:hypothetical protein n=1 Tax=Rhodanobacter sp. DHB23 TaxID=2775923 RepID=UPI00178048AC|nr:hypothetical protein [Rhodanobacter sp. DHB23]MBD8872432.1 hypothetical protein [Rhodanobacter sp. DHB23]
MMVLLMALAGASPTLLATLVGGVLALVLWQCAPRPALLVLLACAMQFAVTLFGAWMQGWWLPAAREAGELSLQRLSLFMGVWGVCSSILHGAVLGLLVWAAFAGRQQARALPPPIG